MNRTDAPSLLASLFSDGGQAILAEGGKSSWEQALAPLPDAVFGVKSPMHPGITLLTLSRDLWNRMGDLRMATAATRGLMRYHVDKHGTENPDALVELGALGVLAQRAGRLDEGADLLEQAWAGLRSVVGGRDLRLAVVAGNLGLHYARVDRLDEAEHLLDTALRIRQKLAPETVAPVAGQLGEVRLRLGNVDAGLNDLRTAWLQTQDTLGEAHPKTIARTQVLANALNQTKNYRESAPLWRDLYKLAVAQGDEEHIASVGFSLGQALYRTHKKEEAIRLLDEALRYARSRTDRTGKVYPALPEWLSFRAQIEIDERRSHQAEGIYLEAVEVERRLSGDDSADTARRYVTVGTLIGKMGRLDEGMGYVDGAASLLRTKLGAKHPWTQAAHASLLELLAEQIDAVAAHDKGTAHALVRHGLQMGGGVLGFDHAGVRRIQALASKHKLT